MGGDSSTTFDSATSGPPAFDSSGADETVGMGGGSGSSDSGLAGSSETGDVGSTTHQSDTTTSENETDGFGTTEDVPDPTGSACSQLAQDCPDGFKCIPADLDGTPGVDSSICVAVQGNGQPGDPCTCGAEEPGDDCALGSYCDANLCASGTASCQEICTGTLDDPSCSGNALCAVTNDGHTTVCEPECYPLDLDCSPGLMCLPHFASGETFTCGPQAPMPAGQGETCGSFNSCLDGYACAAGTVVQGCEGASCCTAYCDLANPQCPEGHSCQPVLPPPLPPALVDLGVCVL